MGSPRVQRWATLLRAYEYKIIYKPGQDHANAEALSRLPLPQTEDEEETDQFLMFEVIEDPPITTKQVKQWTAKDEALSQVLVWCLKGWPREVDARYKPYSQRKLELSVKDGCVLWGARVVIPQRGRKDILKQLHHPHPGISRMKGLARSYVWWPDMSGKQESSSRSTATSMGVARDTLEQTACGIVIVDAHSKWIDVYPTSTATSQLTIERLRQCFSVHGLPQTLVSDNGTCFTSQEFQVFLNQNGIQHITSASFHPASNGLAGRAVQTFKQGKKKIKGDTLETKKERFV
ncbi:hypothetical protein DPEC_G00247610 [Dallia pectoralis]|uniref:Uncharacterized protein n=1 Tax=Dallia pectoralis TaxID=75939 RepID=A0ACC2FWF1_DALPE|nr:hypothetical protein DPEC_G00247610 [Dallia pectoralis]